MHVDASLYFILTDEVVVRAPKVRLTLWQGRRYLSKYASITKVLYVTVLHTAKRSVKKTG